MLKDITLGQFFPGYSAIHRLDPRTKLVMLVVYIVALFLAVSWISYAVMLVFLVGCIAISRISAKAFFRGMKPLIFVLIFTAVLNLFFTQGEKLLVDFADACVEEATMEKNPKLEGRFMAMFLTPKNSK